MPYVAHEVPNQMPEAVTLHSVLISAAVFVILSLASPRKRGAESLAYRHQIGRYG